MEYGREIIDGWIIITKNGQSINFYAPYNEKEEEDDVDWQYVDPIFQAIVVEYGVEQAIQTILTLKGFKLINNNKQVNFLK